MKQYSLSSRILAALFVAGLLWSGYGLYGFLRQRALARNGVWVEARLAEVNLQRTGFRQRLTYVLAFPGSDGTERRLRLRANAAWGDHLQEGDTLRVVYPVGHPEQARPLPHPERAPFGLPAGLLLIIASGWMVVVIRWRLAVGG